MNKDLRSSQLRFLGWISFIIAPLCAIIVKGVYGLPFPESISETATTGNIASFILPFCLGALAIFSFTYSRMHSYEYLPDKLLTMGMAIGFTMVAIFPVQSDYMQEVRVGLLGTSQGASNILHYIGAVSGFGSIITWILICFTKSNRPPMQRTFEKKIRNIVYYIMGGGMGVSLVVFILNAFSILGDGFAIVYWLEAIILTCAAIACWIKGGMLLQDGSININTKSE